MNFRFPLRITLLTTNLLVFVVTFTIIWISATRGLESSVYTMAETLTRETLVRVKSEVGQPMREAKIASQIATSQLRDQERTLGRPLTIKDADEIIFHLHDIMTALPRLSFLSCSFAATGEYVHVERRYGRLEAVKVVRKLRHPGQSSLGQSSGRQRAVDQPAVYYNYLFEGHRLRQIKVEPNYPYAPRQRPYYKDAVAAHQAIWTDPYLFANLQGIQYPGLSYATPIYGPSINGPSEDGPSGDTSRSDASGNNTAGQLRYVLTADFSCQAISEYLGTVQVGQTGYAYVLTQRSDGKPVLIAHPRPAVMLENHDGAIQLMDSSRLTDPVLRAVLPLTLQEATRRGGSFALDAMVDNREFFLGYEGLGEGRLGVGIVVPAQELTQQLTVHQKNITLAGVTSLALGIALSMLISMAISRPLQNAVFQLRRAGRFELQTPRAPPSILAEVDDLGHGIEAMKLGLGSFARYVPADLIRRMLDSGTLPEVGGELCEVTLHFCDVVGFSALSEVLEPDQLFKLLSEMLSELSDEIALSGGTVDKYIGDNIMAFWGAPEPQRDHARRAVQTALNNQARMKELRVGWRQRNLPELNIRIGLHTGLAVVGNIGSPQRLNYTTLGDAVNVASRLEGLNKLYGTSILISESTRQAAGEELLARPLDWVGLAGREQPLMIYEPLGFIHQMDAEQRAFNESLQRQSELALAAYRKRDWTVAANAFTALIQMRNTDTASKLMLSRCLNLAQYPPDKEWDGVFRTAKN